jgi:AraC family transcriptional regulator
VTLAGEWDSVLGGLRLENGVGMLHVEPAEATHANRFGNDGARVLIVQVDLRRNDAAAHFNALLSQPGQMQSPEILPLALRIQRELRLPDDLTPLAVQHLGFELLVAAARAGRAADRKAPRWLIRTEEFLRASLHKPLSVHELSQVAGVHPAHLARVFRLHFGRGPASYVRALRLDEAAMRLAESSRPLADIAAAAGFADQSHFTRQFSKRLGISPARYRRLHRRSSTSR